MLWRVDLVEVRYDRRAENPLSRDILDAGTGVFLPGLVNKTLSPVMNGLTSINGSAVINYKTGTPGTEFLVVPPTLTPGYVPVAGVRIPPAAVSVQAQNVADWRRMLAAAGVQTFSIALSVNAGVDPWQIVSCELHGPPGLVMSVYIKKYTAGGYATNHSIGMTLSGPQFGRYGGAGSITRNAAVVAHANLSSGEFGSFALAAQPTTMQPIQNVFSQGFAPFGPQQVSSYANVVDFFPNPDPVHPRDNFGILGAEWFPLRWKQSSGAWVQGTDALIQNSWFINISGVIVPA